MNIVCTHSMQYWYNIKKKLDSTVLTSLLKFITGKDKVELASIYKNKSVRKWRFQNFVEGLGNWNRNYLNGH